MQPLQIDNVVKQQVQTDNYVQLPAVVAEKVISHEVLGGIFII